jgi:hypothetical protein
MIESRKGLFSLFCLILLFSLALIGHSINAFNQLTLSPAQIIVQDSDLNYTTSLPSLPEQLVNLSEQVNPRIFAEYSAELFKTNVSISSQLLDLTESVTPRIRMEYSSEMFSEQLSSLPSNLTLLTSDISPRIMVEYSSLLFTTSVIEPLQLVNDTTPPLISEPMQVPFDFVNAYQNVTISANVTDIDTGVWKVILRYNVNNAAEWTSLNMTGTSNDTYQTMVPGYENGTLVKYEITAFDNVGNQATKDNNGNHYIYHVGILKPPTIYVISPQNITYSTNNISLTFTTDEPTSWMGYSTDGQENSTIAGNTTLTNLLDGAHYLVVYGNSTSGDMGESNTLQFVIDTAPPNISEISQIPIPTNVTQADEVKINATVTDATSGVNEVTLNYTTNNNTYLTIGMTNLGGDIFTAVIPALPSGTNVNYKIIAEDKANNTITTEQLGFTCQYRVIPEFASFLVLELFLITTLLIAMAYEKRKLHSCNQK